MPSMRDVAEHERLETVTASVSRFLFLEARLLDERRFQDWLALFLESATYWIPANRYDIDPRSEVSLIYDDFSRMCERVGRIESGHAHAQDPMSRTRHLITNVEIEEWKEGSAKTSSNFLLAELRPRREQKIFVGRCEHDLMRVDGSWRIARKKVELLNNNEPIDSLTFLV